LRAFENELGVQDPVGFWDPVGFTSDGDVTAFRRRRTVELKHGRISMLATMGYITPELTGKFPGYISNSLSLKFADIPTGLSAIAKVPALGWAQVVAYCGFCELSAGSDDWKTGTPGDYGFKVLTSDDPAEKEKKLAAEVANGRLAMVAIIGMFFQDGLTGSAWGDWALYTASPLRFFGGDSAPAYKSFDPATALGVQEPVGFWDPLGFSSDNDEATFNRRRSVELKHGRVCMAASIGYIVPYYYKFPGFLSPSEGVQFADVPNGLAALGKVPALGWVQIIFFAGIMEGAFGVTDDYKNGTPGDYGWKVITSDDPAEKEKKLAAELANGRLAMVATIGMFFQDGLTGSAWGDWALYTASPLRAFENELGVQDPVGFWDPVGFTSDGDVTAFRRRRTVELKHGRISMLATMGYITPELTGKFPGYISNSLSLKFADIPTGLSAIAKVPALGWAQVVAYCGFCELSAGSDDWKTGTPGDYGFKVLTSDDPAEKEKKLAAEVANGRLAMVAIIGMFFQDGLTGSAWGDWALYTASPLRFFGGDSAPAYKSFDPATALGVQEPVGFWDPLGFSSDNDEATFNRRRSVELKHGRVCMAASIGYIVPYYYKFPGFLSPSEGVQFADVPNGLAALGKVPALGWVQIIFFAGIMEGAFGVTDDYKNGTPGDYGWKVITSDDPAEKEKKLAAELANGRLAMVAILGMFFQDGLTGSAWGDWALYTASPLRAFENELGVQAPVGFWDPLGFAAEGSAEDFRRRRESELKHGRISMIAALGYIVPEFFKFPGYLAPHLGLKFSEIPNGLAAFSAVPQAGWAQMVFFVGLVEVGFLKQDSARAPGDFANAGTLGVPNGGGAMENEDARKRKLNAELANSRLAMMAIIGMFFQDGLTGSAWGDWALYTGSPLRAAARQ